MPDTQQDADLRVRIAAHWPDARHSSTDQMLPCMLRAGVLLEVLATRTRARIPPLEHVLARVTRARTGRVGVLVAWAWVGLRFFAC